MSVVVLNRVPEAAIEGLRNATLHLDGGVIRDAMERIRYHLQPLDPQSLSRFQQQVVLSQAGPLLNSATSALLGLASASVFLAGLNLVVTVAGFAKVCRKLNDMSAKLDDMNDKLDRLLKGQLKITEQLDLARRAQFAGALENLAQALRTGREGLAAEGLAALQESKALYQLILDRALLDVRAAYTEPEILLECVRVSTASSLARAHAFALLGHLDESSRECGGIRDFLAVQNKRFAAPLQKRPVWLGRLEASRREANHEVHLAFRNAETGLEYAQGYFGVCAECKIDPKAIEATDGGTGMRVLQFSEVA